MEEKENNINYLLYAIFFVVILIVATFAITYAFFKFNVEYDKTLSEVNTSLECINLSLSEGTTDIGLTYDYPITDDKATSNGGATPVTVTVTNNCSSTKKYTLSLSTMTLTNNSDNYIEDNKIRYKVIKNNNDYKGIDYLSNLGTVSSDNQAYKNLIGTDGELAKKYSDYTLKKIYAIEDTISIEANTSNKYNIYSGKPGVLLCLVYCSKGCADTWWRCFALHSQRY